ncbi:hypothetical protein O162_30610 [Pseudomonas putida SJ3]|nr:hypothetical protein O162_30610 [Pseudomonas putida SJ3]
MTGLRLSDLLEPVMQLAYEAGLLIESELNRPDGPRGSGFKADVDVEIEVLLRQRLKHILNCDFVGEETGCELSGDDREFGKNRTLSFASSCNQFIVFSMDERKWRKLFDKQIGIL